MSTLIITVDPECCRCRSKMQKILCGIQECGEFVIDNIVYQKDKVMVSGPFDANKLSCKLCCKAGRIIKNIEVAKPPEPPKPNPKPSPWKLILYPYPSPHPGWPCGCPLPYCQCPQPPCPEPNPEPKLEPEPAPCVLLPHPYPYPAWPCSCPPPYCQCHAKSPPPPKPESPKRQACQCPTWPSCRCYGYPPPYMPPPMPCPMVVCDESPPYGACAIM